MKRKLRIITPTILLAFFAIFTAGATEYIFNGFSSTSNLTLNGTAFVTNTTDGFVIRLVRAQGNQSGSFFSSLPIQASTYSASLKFRITNPGGPGTDVAGETGGDGLAFVVQAVTNSIGGNGGGIGYYGTTNSVDIEFDTVQNNEVHDPNSNHLGINRRRNFFVCKFAEFKLRAGLGIPC